MRPLIGITAALFGLDQESGDFEYDRLARGYAACVERAGGLAVLIPARLTRATAPLLIARLDGLLLSGGADLDPVHYGEERAEAGVVVQAARDESELALYHAARVAGCPVFAICRGLQLVNVAEGGTLYQDTRLRPDTPPHRSLDGLTPIFHDAHIAPGSALAALAGGETVRVNSYHHQHIRVLAPGLTQTATAPDGSIEAFEGPASAPFLLGVQWHPERLPDEPLTRALFSAFIDAARTAS